MCVPPFRLSEHFFLTCYVRYVITGQSSIINIWWWREQRNKFRSLLTSGICIMSCRWIQFICVLFCIASAENSGLTTLNAVFPADILYYTFHCDELLFFSIKVHRICNNIKESKRQTHFGVIYSVSRGNVSDFGRMFLTLK